MTEDERNQLYKSLDEIFCEILDLPEKSNLDCLTMLNTEKWDSLAMVNLIAAIESSYALKLESADYETMTSVVAVRMLVEEKLNN